MQSYIPEINFDNMREIEQAYWDLADPALICAPNFQSPDMSSIWAGKFIPIVCKEGDEIVGLMCIKEETNGIYYPVMKGDLAAVLANMCAFAQDTFDHLTATTDNEFIHGLAQRGGRPFTRDGNTLNWSR
jgi:hypothetical protein